jgi:allophanate hydrolase subunit 2
MIGQLRPNDNIFFEKISIDHAREEFKKQNSLSAF